MKKTKSMKIKLLTLIFPSEYYKKDNSLLMAAYKRGTPIETIEVNLEKMEVVQSRGLQNKAAEYNKQIVQLVSENMSKIAKLHAS